MLNFILIFLERIFYSNQMHYSAEGENKVRKENKNSHTSIMVIKDVLKFTHIYNGH